jgi:hypothetical protein
MITLYARQEPSKDPILLEYAPKTKRYDTVFYRDPDCKDLYCIWEWDKRPPRSRKTVTLNCCTYAVEWLPRKRYTTAYVVKLESANKAMTKHLELILELSDHNSYEDYREAVRALALDALSERER